MDYPEHVVEKHLKYSITECWFYAMHKITHHLLYWLMNAQSLCIELISFIGVNSCSIVNSEDEFLHQRTVT